MDTNFASLAVAGVPQSSLPVPGSKPESLSPFEEILREPLSVDRQREFRMLQQRALIKTLFELLTPEALSLVRELSAEARPSGNHSAA